MLKRYRLAPGTQVRKEDFGLLFYTMAGPRLYFLPSGQHLEESFFLTDCADKPGPGQYPGSGPLCDRLEAALKKLANRGVIHEL